MNIFEVEGYRSQHFSTNQWAEVMGGYQIEPGTPVILEEYDIDHNWANSIVCRVKVKTKHGFISRNIDGGFLFSDIKKMQTIAITLPEKVARKKIDAMIKHHVTKAKFGL